MTEPLIASLQAALQVRPDDIPLRLHLAELLLANGNSAEAISHAAQALQRDPANAAAQALMSKAIGGPPPPSASPMDWRAYEEELSDVVPPRFVRADGDPDPVEGEDDRAFDVETSSVRLADVGG